MKIISHGIGIKTLKRDLILRFTLLLSIFLILLITAQVFSSKSIASKEYDSVMVNIAGRQRMLIHQYVSEINQSLIGLATLDLKMALSKKRKSDSTANLFEKTLKAFSQGGEISTDLKGNKLIVIPPLKNEKILQHLKLVDKEWNELKRIALLSLRSDMHSISKSPYVRHLLDQAVKSVIEMDRVVTLMQHDSEVRLRQIDTLLTVMTIIGLVLFLLLIYYVYSSIVLPLDKTVRSLKETTDKLEIEKTEAEKANQAKSEFLSHMSHELRTPMNAILGFGQMLELDAEGFNETQRTSVNEILDAGYHLLSLINEVLDLAKIESGKLEISMEDVVVNDVMKQCISLIANQAEARHIELVDQLSNQGHVLKVDFTRLKQVLLNFLSNAVKYNRDNGRITIDSEIVGNKRLRIRVTDTGEGLTSEEVTRLFTPFDRLNAKSNVEGTGIGLTISKHLVELMGGTIGIDSMKGKGSVFWAEFTLSDNLI